MGFFSERPILKLKTTSEIEQAWSSQVPEVSGEQREKWRELVVKSSVVPQRTLAIKGNVWLKGKVKVRGSPERYWRGPRWQEVGEAGDQMPSATLSPPE